MLPRFPQSPLARQAPDPTQETQETTRDEADPGPDPQDEFAPPRPRRVIPRSSRASTDPDDTPRPKPPSPEEVKETQGLIAEAADMAFVLFAGLAQFIHRKRTGKTEPDSRWTPSPKERKAIAMPASRLAARRIPQAEFPVKDAADVAMVGLGVGRYVTRAALGLDPLDPLEEED